MPVFTLLLLKIVPLYIYIFLGYLAGKFLKADKTTVASILIYLISPVIVFNGVVTTPMVASNLFLPVLFFSIASLISLSAFRLSGNIWHDTTKNILAFTSGAGNVGYFGLPVAVALFDDSIAGLVVMAVLGIILYENTVGFYITARGRFSARESILKVCKLPALYAFAIGLLINLCQIPLPVVFTETISVFRGAYTILGMMLIGLGLAGIVRFKFDLKFLSMAFMARFILWPLLMGLVILLDSTFLHLYSHTVHRLLVLLSIVPLAANTVAFATQLKAQPEKAAFTVMASTVFALFYIPLVTAIFIK